MYISAAILSGAFGGLIAGAIEDGLDGVHGLPGWKWLFIVSVLTSRILEIITWKSNAPVCTG